MAWTIRSATAADIGFLEEMLVHAATWRSLDARPDRTVLENPNVSRYLSGWGRRGDAALVAEGEEGEPVGAAWLRLFSKTEPGYGFIDETIPEITIGVRPQSRNRGIGSSLLSSLRRSATERGFHALSLSVEADNPALRLYVRSGFRVITRSGGACTMRLDLTAEN